MELILHFLLIGGQRLPEVKTMFMANTVYVIYPSLSKNLNSTIGIREF